jgi:hypothetical protein
MTSYSGIRLVLQNNFGALIDVIEKRFVQLPFEFLREKTNPKISIQISFKYIRCITIWLIIIKCKKNP